MSAAVTAVSVSAPTGLRLVGDVVGPEHGSPVVLLPGGGQTRRTWWSTARALGDRGWRAFTFDHRGHGESDWAPDGDYSLDAFVGDIHMLVRHIGEPPVFVGASLGGMAAMVAIAEAAGESPVGTALVLVDVAHELELKGRSRIREFMLARPDGYADVEEAAATVTELDPRRRRPVDPARLRHNLRQRPDGRWVWHWDPRFLDGGIDGDPARSPMGALRRRERAARSLDVPTLLVRGRASDVLSAQGAAAFLAIAPNARFVDVEGAGHMVVGDRNDKFLDAVLGFLHGQDRRVGVVRNDEDRSTSLEEKLEFGSEEFRRRTLGLWREIFEENGDLAADLRFSQSYEFYDAPAHLAPGGGAIGFHYRWDRGTFESGLEPASGCDITFHVSYEVARMVWTAPMIEPGHQFADPEVKARLEAATADGRFVRIDKAEIPAWFHPVHNRIAALAG